MKRTLDNLGPDPLPPLVPSTESDSDSSDDEAPEIEPSEPVVKWHKDSYREFAQSGDCCDTHIS